MTEFKDMPEPENSVSTAAQGNRQATVGRKVYRFLTSAKLAMALLIAILACCIIGVTLFRGQRAGEMIFGTLWFNGLLVLLVLNVGFCFFGRIWGRKLTLISLGMVLFHLSFVAIFGGIIYNSLYYFRGTIRLTEGETLSSGDPQSYDYADHGRFFTYSRLKGETTLVKMHANYKIEGTNKRAAYEISVGEGGLKKQGIMYITHNLDYRGFRYIPDREGYTLLLVLYYKQGRELNGAYIPLQSLRQKDNSYLYTTGTKDGPGIFPFPQDTESPLFDLQVVYRPTPIKERAGEALFKVWLHNKAKGEGEEKPLTEGKAAIGDMFSAGEYLLSAKEVRYWAAMSVRYEPGQPIVLMSLWLGLGGLVITFIGRLRRKRKN